MTNHRIEPKAAISVIFCMKILLYFLFSTLNLTAQEFQRIVNPFELQDVTLPVYYYPFYDDVQIIEVDYFQQSLEQGAWEDAIHPRGSSSYHDALSFNRENGYLVRNISGKIIANYGVMNVDQLQLLPPDSCKTITHQERMNVEKPNAFAPFQRLIKKRCGAGYRISRLFVSQQRTEMPEMGVELFGVLDTLGNIAIPMANYSIDYAYGDYLVHRYIHSQYITTINPIAKGLGQIQYNYDNKPYAIYDSTFTLTLLCSEFPLQRIERNCYARLEQHCVSFIDRFGRSLTNKTYESIQLPRFSDLIIYAERKNDTIAYGLLSRQLEEVTPALFSSITSFENGFMMQDRQRRNGFLNLHGKQIVSFELESVTIDYRRDDMISFTRYVEMPNGKMLCSGLIDTTGKIILPPEYWRINEFYKDIALVMKDNKFGIVDRSGTIVCPIIYDGIGNFHRNFIEVYKDRKRGLIDLSGREILEPNYSYIDWIDSLIHFGNEQEEHFIYDVQSGKTFQHYFGRLIPQKNGLSFFKKGEKYGLVNAQGKQMIPAQFDKVRAYINDRALVEMNAKLGLIDQNGKIIKEIKYSRFSYDDEGNYVLK
jgi:hypothetical protein